MTPYFLLPFSSILFRRKAVFDSGGKWRLTIVLHLQNASPDGNIAFPDGRSGIEGLLT
jgi:hypothetical protein